MIYSVHLNIACMYIYELKDMIMIKEKEKEKAIKIDKKEIFCTFMIHE